MYWHKTPVVLEWLYPSLEWHGSRREKVLYLTFDDGPVPEETAFILDTLGEFGVNATFFCVGDNVRKHPALFERILSEGHKTGNHTMHHVKGWGMDTERYLEDVEECSREMAKFGVHPEFFRPPYGKASRDQLSKLAAYRIIMWDVLSGDFDNSLSPENCLRATKRAVRNGSIIIFHDNVKAHDRLRYALPAFIHAMSEQEYEFRTL